MVYFLESVIITLTCTFALVLGLLYAFFTHKYTYWKRKGVPFVEPTFPFGSISDVLFGKTDIGKFYQRFYKEFKHCKYGGIMELWYPAFIVTDLNLAKQIITKDFSYFTNRVLPPKSSHDFLVKNLFFMDGEDGWKEMRVKLTPTFSSGKMKVMYSLIEKCSRQLKDHLEPLASRGGSVDVKEVMSRYTLDIIASCAFGLDVNTLSDSDTDIHRISQLIFTKSKTLILKRYFMINFPKIADLLKMTLFNKEVSDFLLELITNTVKYREENNVDRNDFLNLLIKVKNNQTVEESLAADDKDTPTFDSGLTLKEITAQAFVFFAAGFETAASTTTFVLYELARHPDVQQRLRREVDEVVEKHGGRITYQALQEMKYMEQVVNETMRMHGSAPLLLRKCVKTYRVPDTEVDLDVGVKVVVPLYAIHHDPDIYPDPEVFDPERFTEDNTRRRHNYSFLPFGEGPRMCIGMRFGKMQVKAGLATIIANYDLCLTPDTPVPVKISPRIVVTTPEHPIKLNITTRSK